MSRDIFFVDVHLQLYLSVKDTNKLTEIVEDQRIGVDFGFRCHYML